MLRRGCHCSHCGLVCLSCARGGPAKDAGVLVLDQDDLGLFQGRMVHRMVIPHCHDFLRRFRGRLDRI